MALPNFTMYGSSTGGGGSSGVGRTAYGTVPAPIATPPNIFSQVNSTIPGFGGLTQGSSNLIGSELSGEVSPATLNALKNASAQWGVQSGMPGSGLQGNQLFGNIAGYSEGRQRMGLQDYLGTLAGVGHSMTDPGLAAEIASRNATLASAPDPKMAADEQLRQWMLKFGLTNNLGGYSPSGGTGAYGGRPPDALGGGGYSGPKDALGMPITDMSGGAMGNYWNSAGASPITQHLPTDVSSYSSGNSLPLPGSGSHGGLQYNFFGDKYPDYPAGMKQPFNWGTSPSVNRNPSPYQRPNSDQPLSPEDLLNMGYFPQDVYPGDYGSGTGSDYE